jgi:hypothetical protein
VFNLEVFFLVELLFVSVVDLVRNFDLDVMEIFKLLLCEIFTFQVRKDWKFNMLERNFDVTESIGGPVFPFCF